MNLFYSNLNVYLSKLARARAELSPGPDYFTIWWVESATMHYYTIIHRYIHKIPIISWVVTFFVQKLLRVGPKYMQYAPDRNGQYMYSKLKSIRYAKK